ncbi:MAG: hypothetical protein KW804_00600 [Candidatus Doudnabacteria bacterium]|nr:hypothetical protein [Candidatus Doudnabacteria bacterium]
MSDNNSSEKPVFADSEAEGYDLREFAARIKPDPPVAELEQTIEVDFPNVRLGEE